jgi:hypothetical protein
VNPKSNPWQVLLTGAVESYRRGYPRYSAVVAADDSFCLCRRFSHLRSRRLLLKQDKLSMLEKRIDEIDESEPRALFLGKSRCDRNQERNSLLAEADQRLAEYGMHAVAMIDPPVAFRVMLATTRLADLSPARLVRRADLSNA